MYCWSAIALTLLLCFSEINATRDGFTCYIFQQRGRVLPGCPLKIQASFSVTLTPTNPALCKTGFSGTVGLILIYIQVLLPCSVKVDENQALEISDAGAVAWLQMMASSGNAC